MKVLKPLRHNVEFELISWNLAALIDDVVLMVSEVAGNALEHGDGPVSVTVRLRIHKPARPMLTCFIEDHSHDVPVHNEEELFSERGRGMLITLALADEIGVRQTRFGKTIWFRVPVTEQSYVPARAGLHQRPGH